MEKPVGYHPDFKSVTLNGQVVEVGSAVSYDDHIQRVTVLVDNPAVAYNSKLSFRNTAGFILDQRVTVTIEAAIQPRKENEQ
jgi:sulfur carrier protein ThiS